jgi:peptidoglycan hydrolase-like protein with peptidoglycan-binding domain
MLVKLKLAGFSNAFITEFEVKKVPVDNGGTLGLSIPVEIIPDPNVKEYTFSGVYNETVRKVQSYLNQNGARLTADGIFGPKTYQKLSDAYKVDTGYRSELVKCVQLRLNELGFNCGTADGIAGTNTMSAIAKFQKANNLGEGYLGGEDWYYLFK